LSVRAGWVGSGVVSSLELELEELELLSPGVGLTGVAGFSPGKGKASCADFFAAGVGESEGAAGDWSGDGLGLLLVSPGKGNFSAVLGLEVGVAGFVPQGSGTGAT
jgi:hypothetical protein